MKNIPIILIISLTFCIDYNYKFSDTTKAATTTATYWAFFELSNTACTTPLVSTATKIKDDTNKLISSLTGFTDSDTYTSSGGVTIFTASVFTKGQSVGCTFKLTCTCSCVNYDCQSCR